MTQAQWVLLSKSLSQDADTYNEDAKTQAKLRATCKCNEAKYVLGKSPELALQNN